MKRITLSIFATALLNTVVGQVNTTHFHQGVPKRALGVSVEPLSNPNGGQGLRWDFSDLSPNGEEFEVQYILPTQEITNRFPGANMVMKLNEAGNEVFSVIRKTSEGIEEVAMLATVEGTESETVYVNAKVAIPSVLSFNAQQQDEFYKKLDLSSSGIDLKVGTLGRVNHHADATGTIVLPNGEEVTDVVRLTSREVYTDTVNLQIPGFPAEPELVEGRTKTYNWYKNDGSGNPLLFSLVEDSTFSEGEWQVNVSGFYLTNLATQVAATAFSPKRLPFPSHVENILSIPVEKETTDRIVVSDQTGREVFRKEIEKGSIQTPILQVSLGHLSPGIYFVRSEGKEAREQKPFRVVKL